MRKLLVVVRYKNTTDALNSLIWSIKKHVKGFDLSVLVLCDHCEEDFSRVVVPAGLQAKFISGFRGLITRKTHNISLAMRRGAPAITSWLSEIRDEFIVDWLLKDEGLDGVLYVHSHIQLTKDIDFIDNGSFVCGEITSKDAENKEDVGLLPTLMYVDIKKLREYGVKVMNPYWLRHGLNKEHTWVPVFNNMLTEISEIGGKITNVDVSKYYRTYNYWNSPRDVSKIPRQRSCIVCIAKLEDNYLKEWVDYHLKIGVDEIFIYQNNWRTQIQFDNRVHLIEWDRTDCYAQVDCYNDFIQNRRGDFDFAIFIDVDEFINILHFDDIGEFLKHYVDRPGLRMFWRFFGSNGQETVSNGNYSVIDRFTRCGSKLVKTGKTILNLKFTEDLPRMVSAHHCHYTHLKTSVTDLTRCAQSRYVACVANQTYVLDECLKVAYINHYKVKTWEEHAERYKIKADRSSYSCSYYGNGSMEKKYRDEDYRIQNQNDVEDLHVYNIYHDVKCSNEGTGQGSTQ